MKRRATLLVATAGLILAAAVSAPAFPLAQEAPAAKQAPEEQPAAHDDSAVREILRQQEELLRGQAFSYDPQDRRDPFRSLFAPDKSTRGGPRPPGVAGMLVGEIDLTGIVEDTETGHLAFFVGSDNKGYFLRVGERVFDATLIAIDGKEGSVTFRQEVDDPRQIKPYRDVVRRLTPLDEGSNP